MLSLLHIENVAVVEKADIEFGPGFNVLTGETGAGKSIVIDSLQAALGYRVSRELVRRGAKSATVTAVFTDADVGDFFENNGMENDGELILSRKISEEGKSSCRLNGAPISSSQLRELGLRLMDIHGQGDGQRLTDEKYHRDFLDAYGEIDTADYRAAYDSYRALKEEAERVTLDESEKERRLDILNFQIEELERADLREGEYDEKLARRTLLKNAGKLTEAVMDAANALSGGENSDGAASLIETAASSVEYASRFSQELAAISVKLNDLKYAVQDVSEEIQDVLYKLDFSPEELDVLDERLDGLRRVLRKYGGTESEALAFLERCRRERDSIEYSEERLKKLEARMSAAEREMTELAGHITEKRRETAEKLSKRIEDELKGLSMNGARFQVEITPCEMGPHGADNVRFLMSANAGESVGRISRVASGGELSRIMLAIKTVLSSRDPVGSMVFDEIDAGISGVAARRVAEKMAAIARDKQVLCVTHLPQIAAMADAHFLTAKEISGGRTFTSVTRLDYDGRRQELARLIGGDIVTRTTLDAAGEQLSAAERWKSGGAL